MSNNTEDPSWLKEVLDRISKESEVDRAVTTTLKLMSDHTLRKTDLKEAVKEFEVELGKVRAILSTHSTQTSGRNNVSLPTLVDIDHMSVAEVAEIKKSLCSLVSACDKKLSKN